MFTFNDESFKIIKKILEDNKEPLFKTITKFKNFDEVFKNFDEVFKNNKSETVEAVKTFDKGLYVELPGFSKEEINLEVEKETNILSIKGKTTSPINLEVSITCTLNKEDKIKEVELTNGILYIYLEQVKPETEKIIIK